MDGCLKVPYSSWLESKVGKVCLEPRRFEGSSPEVGGARGDPGQAEFDASYPGVRQDGWAVKPASSIDSNILHINTGPIAIDGTVMSSTTTLGTTRRLRIDLVPLRGLSI